MAVGVLLGVIFWREIEHFLASMVAATICYKILKHRYFPSAKTTRKSRRD